MAELSELKDRANKLMSRYETANKKRSELRGQLNAIKAELSALGDEIKAAGFDPKTLRAERDKAHQELENLIESFESELAVVEKAISAFEEK